MTNRKNYKIIRLYIISLICIVGYIFLDNSNIISELVENSNKGRDSGFIMFIFTGIVKYGLLVIGVGIIIILSFLLIKEKLVKNSDSKSNKKTLKNAKNQTENRNLKLVVFHNFGQDAKIIAEKATNEIIRNTMNSVNWNEFHIVQLEDEHDNSLHVSGSLRDDDDLASGFTKEDDHILLVKPIKTVEQMTEILLDFLKGEDFWKNKYNYE